MKRMTFGHMTIPAALTLTLVLAACGGGQEDATDAVDDATGAVESAASGDAPASDAPAGDASGEVVVDGSSTVAPLTSAAGELFTQENAGVNVSVATSGTGGGFEKFCLGETDISNASRAIEEDETAVCDENGVEYTELQVATDALTVVVSADNDFITCLTVEELATLWGPEAENTITTWDQVNPEFPAETIELYGPGTDSGTFDYFTGEVNGEEGASRADYNASEDDNLIVQGVSGSANALGYFGYTYFEENAETLKAVEVDSGDGCVAPSPETSADGTYTPLSRPLFIYVSNASYADKPQVASFIDYFVANDAEIAEASQFIALNDEQRTALTDAAAALAG